MLVHCSDGWDRTTQVCATAQLLIDPFYRTHVDLQLLCKWCAFGRNLENGLGTEAQFSDDQHCYSFNAGLRVANMEPISNSV